MRQQLIDSIKALKLANFAVSQDLPYSSSGEEMFIKNVKRIYVDNPEMVREPFLAVLGASNVESTVTTVSVYFTTDAKQQPSNFDTVVQAIMGVKEQFKAQYFRRECSVTTELLADLQVVEIEFRFTQLS